MTTLLDANVLIALVVTDHVHHDAAEEWFERSTDHFATCPITQGRLLRLLIREGQPAASAVALLRGVTEHERHEFWPDSVGYADVRVNSVLGHRQVTDAYLAQLARARDGKLVTFDGGLAAAHGDVAELLKSG